MILNFFNKTVFLIIVIVFNSCTNENISNDIDSDIVSLKRGELESIDLVKNVKVSAINDKFNNYNIDLYAETDISSFKIEYTSINKNYELITASGIIVIPQNINYQKEYPILLYHHGAIFQDIEAPSFIGTDLISEALASDEYLVVIPDYIGYGTSTNEEHPYMHKSISNSSIDLLKASKKYFDQEKIKYNKLFLTGYSEGGYATLSTAKEIETNYSHEFNITAIAPMSGAYNLYDSAKEMLSNNTYDSPAFLAYLVFFYQNYYSWNIEIFNNQYKSKLPELFNGEYNAYTINLELPNKITELFTSSFLFNFKNNLVSEDIQNDLISNSFNNWLPKVPIRLYHGLNDITVPYSNSLSYYELLRSNNIDTELITYDGDHYSSAIYLHLRVKEWFDNLK